jgi:hypothetical protein
MPNRDVHPRPIAYAGLAIAATVAAVIAAVFLLLHLWQLPPAADRARLPYRSEIEGAALQSAPQSDLARYGAEKRKLLDSSEWVDASQGIVRIPIADAMDLLAQAATRPASASEVRP